MSINIVATHNKRFTDCSNRLTPLIDAFVADAAEHFQHERRFFKDHIYRPLLARAPQGIRVPAADEVIESFLSVIARTVGEYPQHFIRHEYKRPFMPALLSIHHLKSDTSKMENLVWLTDNAFIDTGKSRPLSGVKLTVNVLNELKEAVKPAREHNDQFTIREFALTLLNAFDYQSMRFEQPRDWMSPLKLRDKRKRGIKESYLAQLDNVWTVHQLGKALTQDDKQDPTFRHGKSGRCNPISRAAWQHVVRSEISRALPKHMNSAAKAQGQLLRLHLEQRERLNDIGAAIFERIRRLRKPFAISPAEITSRLRQSLQEAVSDPSAAHIYAEANARVELHRKRLKRMRLSGTTLRVYEPCLPISGLIQGALEQDRQPSPPSLYDLHIHLTKIGVTAATTRNLIKQLYPLDIAKCPRRFHNHCLDLYPAFARWALSMPEAPGRERLYTQAFQMLTSHLAGGEFDVNILEDMHTLADASESLNDARYKSLKQLAADLNRNNVALEQALSKAKKLGFTVEKEDIELCANMRLARALGRLMQHAPAVPPEVPEEIRQQVGELSVSILPYNRLKGVLGAGVPGVCIQFGTEYHRQHIRPECRNLVVHDNKRIYLWGLLVESSTRDHYYLNNFQGALPSRLRKYGEEIIFSARQLLSELGTVYLLDFYFNSMSLCDDLPVARDVALKVPKMRLDIPQAPDGTLEQNDFYVIRGTDRP